MDDKLRELGDSGDNIKGKGKPFKNIHASEKRIVNRKSPTDMPSSLDEES